MENVLEGTHTSGVINTPAEYADGLDHSCRTLFLLVGCAQRAGEPIVTGIPRIYFSIQVE